MTLLFSPPGGLHVLFGRETVVACDFFPQAKLAGFSFRAGVHTPLEVKKISRNVKNQANVGKILLGKNVPDQVAKTCPGRFSMTVSHFCNFFRLQKRARVDL